MKKIFPFSLGVITGITLCNSTQLWHYFLDLPIHNQIYWSTWTVIAVIFLILGIPFKKEQRKPQPVLTSNDWQAFYDSSKRLETNWNNALSHTSILLLTGCAIYAFSEGLHQVQLNKPILILSLSSLYNAIVSALFPLSSYFYSTYPFQQDCIIHRFLYRIIEKLAPIWNLFTLAVCLIQAMAISYIIINLL